MDLTKFETLGAKLVSGTGFHQSFSPMAASRGGLLSGTAFDHNGTLNQSNAAKPGPGEIKSFKAPTRGLGI